MMGAEKLRMRETTEPSARTVVNVRLFALAKQLANSETLRVPIPQRATVADVRRGLILVCPALAGMIDQMLIAVDSEYAEDRTPVTDESEIACIPPVSGG